MMKDNIRRLMDEQGLTPEALAVRIQAGGHAISASTIRGWMCGTRTPNFPNAQALAQALACKLDDLIEQHHKAAV